MNKIIKFLKGNRYWTSFAIFMIFMTSFLIFYNSPSIYQDGGPLSLISSFSTRTDEDVDGDSDVDGVDNVGVSNSSYTDSQSLNGQYQGFWEEGVGGGVANDTDFLYNNTDDNYSPTDVGTYSDATKMNVDDNDYNTLTEVQSGNAFFDTINDVDSDSSDVDSNADNGIQGTFANAQGSAPDSSYMNLQETNTSLGEGFAPEVRFSINDIGDPDLGYIWSYGAGEGYGFNSITSGVETIFDESRDVWLNNATVKAKLLNCTYVTAYDGFDLACYHGIYAGKDIWFYPQNTTLRKGSEGIALRPNQLRYYQLSTGDSQKWVDATVVDPTYDPNDDFKRITYNGVYPATTYNFWYDRGSIKEIINMSALPNQYPAPPYPVADTYLIHIQDIIMKQAYTWFDDDGAITDTKWNLSGSLRLTQSGKLLGVFPTGIVWSSVSSQRVESPVVASLVRISDTQWQLGSALPYGYLSNTNRDGHVYIDPTWDVGLDEANWNNNTVMKQVFYNTTSQAVELNNSFTGGWVKSFIKVANANWERIRFYGSLNDGSINIYFNHSSNPSQDPYTITLIKTNAQSGTIYTLPTPSAEKFGGWIFTLNRDSVFDISPQIFNITLYNDDSVAFYDPTSDVQADWNDGTGGAPWYTEIDDGDRTPDTPASLADYIQESSDNAISEHNFDAVTETIVNQISIWAYLTTTARKNIWIDCEEDGSTVCTQTIVPLSETEQWYYANWTSVGGTTVGQMSELFTCDKNGGGSPTDCIVYNAYMAVIYTVPPNPYIIDFEYQWNLEGGSWLNDTAEVAIYSANNPSTENLLVYYWKTGSTWASLGTISSDGWLNVTFPSDYLGILLFTIRFIGSNETANDDDQDDWDIDLMVVYTAEPESRVNRFDREVSFLNVTQALAGSDLGKELADIPFINNGFEDGDLTGWTATSGSCTRAVDAGSARSGAYGYGIDCGAIESDNAYQDLDISSLATEIAAGDVYVNLTVWFKTDCNDAVCTARFRTYTVSDCSSGFVGDIKTYTAPTSPVDWYSVNLTNYNLNTNVRCIRLQAGVLSVGVFTNDVDIDDAWLTIWIDGSENISALEGLHWTNHQFEEGDFTGWTVSGTCTESVTLSLVENHDQNNYKALIACITSSTTSSVRQKLDVNADYASAITAGTFYARGQARCHITTGDSSIQTLRWQWLDSSSTFISTAGQQICTTDSWVEYSIEYAQAPSNAYYFQFLAVNFADAGEDGTMHFDEPYIEFKSNGTSGGGYIYDYVELAVNTGSLDADEVISVSMYNVTETSWVFVTNLTSASAWTNISIISNYTQNLYLRFVDTNQSVGDLDTDTWQIDYFALHLWNGSGSVYRFNWEHNATSIPTGAYDFHVITIYGNTSEDMDVYMWNSSSSAWNTTPVLTISSTLQWYNASVTGTGLFGATMTWNYRDTITSTDDVNSTMAIDYAGVFVYSLEVNISEATFGVTAIPDSSDYSITENPLDIVPDAGNTFDIQIRGTDTGGTPVADGWIFFDTDASPAGYTQLTTSWQDLYTSQAYTVTLLQVWLWANVLSPEQKGDHTFDLEVRIILS